MHDVKRLAGEAREFLEAHWADWHVAWGPPTPSRPSEWTCVRSSIFVQQVLAQVGVCAEMASGVPDQAGAKAFGFFGQGRWRSHAWLRAGSMIIDVTADQFGADDVIVSTVTDARYSEGRTTESTLRITKNQVAAVAAIWPSWCLLRS